MHVHTHPKVKIGESDFIYTFFSSADLNSLMSGKWQILGLITDRLWVIAKTKDSRIWNSDASRELQEAERTGTLAAKAAEITSRHGFVLYSAEFGGGELKRVY